ncbi:MAG: CRISPR-associated protein Cas4 [Anaerolineae bacterium]|nr:CRISPR-associated protein Cas4 [Anaerolineae bacterium]
MLTRDEPHLFRVIDLKQYIYCPRILYYHTVLPQIRPITYKMEVGIQAHVSTEIREKRRSLRTYGIESGVRHFNVALHDFDLGLSGEIDMVIETHNELIPVDYKNTGREGKHFRLQLAAYARLLEAAWRKPAKRGFLYMIPDRKVVSVRMTPHVCRELDKALRDLQLIATAQLAPAPTLKHARCVDCEFRRFCNDVL